MLKRTLSLQKDAVAQYERALGQASDKLQECYTRQGDYAQRLEEAKNRQAQLKQEVASVAAAYKQYSAALGETDSATIAARGNLDLVKEEYRQQTAEVRKLFAQQTALQKSTQNAADAFTTAQTKLNNARAAVKQTQADIESCNRALKTAQSQWTAMGKTLEGFGKKASTAGKVLTSAGKTLTTMVTAPIVAMGTAAVKASLDFESSFTSVRKTVDATEAEFSALASASKSMSTQIAASTTQINEVMATAGQLGIANDYLVDFTRTMIDLGNSTDIVANDARLHAGQVCQHHDHGPVAVRQSGRDAGRLGQQLRHGGVRHHEHVAAPCGGRPPGGADGAADSGLRGGAVLGGRSCGDGRFGVFQGADQHGGGRRNGRGGAGGLRPGVRHDGGGLQGAVGQRPRRRVSGIYRGTCADG